MMLEHDAPALPEHDAPAHATDVRTDVRTYEEVVTTRGKMSPNASRAGGQSDSPRTWHLNLPYPSPPLRDNDRLHWAAKARTVAELRRTAMWLAYHAKLPSNLPFVTIRLCWQPGSIRRRDPLSIAPTLKPLVDGLVDYGLVADDDTAHVKLETDIREPLARKPSKTWLEIVEGRA